MFLFYGKAALYISRKLGRVIWLKKITTAIIKLVWIFACIIAAAVAFIPIMPSGFLVDLINRLPYDISSLGFASAIVALLFYAFFYIYSLIYEMKKTKRTNDGGIKAFVKRYSSPIIVFIIPIIVAFSLALSLRLNFKQGFMLLSPLTYIIYLISGVGIAGYCRAFFEWVRAKREMSEPSKSDEEVLIEVLSEKAAWYGFDEIGYRYEQKKQDNAKRYQDNKRIYDSSGKKRDTIENRGGKIIRTLIIIYFAASMLLILPSVLMNKNVSDTLNKVWAILLPYTPALSGLGSLFGCANAVKKFFSKRKSKTD